MTRLKLWDSSPSWEKAEQLWEKTAEQAALKKPLKGLKVLPSMPGLTPETARNLKWKSLKYMIAHDAGHTILKHVLKKPFVYGFRYLKSLMKKKSFVRQGDFFLYGIQSIEEFCSFFDKKHVLAVGFSYCQKPHECPSGRFTDQCIHSLDNPICQQCPIGKVVHALPEKNTVPLFIPTIHYIGDQMFKLAHAHPDKEILFIITACELTLKMFGDFGNMARLKGIGLRLDGRICNTMKAFELSEGGVKPGLTLLTDDTQKRFLELIRTYRGTKS